MRRECPTPFAELGSSLAFAGQTASSAYPEPLNLSKFHTLLFRVSLITELQFCLRFFLLFYLFILGFQKECSYEFNVPSIHGTCPYLARHTFNYLVEIAT